MSKSSAIFSYTPVKNLRSSPVSSRANRTGKNQQGTPSLSESSPRKCKITTDVQSSPRGANFNVKSKLQFNCPMSPKLNPDRPRQITKPSPRKDQKLNTTIRDAKTQNSPCTKVLKAPGNAKVVNSRRETPVTSRSGLSEADSTRSEEPANVNVKSMRSCFEQKVNKVPAKPPPSPSPSRHKTRLAETQQITPRNTNPNIKSILTSRSKYNNTPTFRVPSGSSTPTPRSAKPSLRRSVSTGTLLKTDDSPQPGDLTRSRSQLITPKHRVKFQDEAATPECFSPVLLEPKVDHGSGDSLSGETTNLTVAVRVRPTFSGEWNVVSVEDNAVKVKVLGSETRFSYDYCFDQGASQQDVFNTMVEPLVDVAFQGYNVCLFAYGQTGSGKSYCMMGEEITTSHSVPESAGIIPRFSQQLFNIIEGAEEFSHTKVEISYFEIYNEKIHDLLGPSQSGRSAPLRVREHPELGPYVVDLTVHTVRSFETLQDWLSVGNSHRETAATEMNMNSSRSHSIFTVTLTQSQTDDRPSLCSKINLIDLAGSERLAHTCATGDRLKEGVSINRSLFTLGKVISSLAENKKRVFIPYRESVLTWLLRESLGGNSRTAMLATISPSSQFTEETLSTLRYACQARNIINTVRINESPHEKKIRELIEEIQRLKGNIDVKDHAECIKMRKNLERHLEEANKALNRANIVCTESEIEIGSLLSEVANRKETTCHDECDRKMYILQKELAESNDWNTRSRSEKEELRTNLTDVKGKNKYYEEQLNELGQHIDEISKSNSSYKDEIYKLEVENKTFRKETKELKSEIIQLKENLAECRIINSNYESDLCDMKRSMLNIKNSSNHNHCDRHIKMLQTALKESESLNITYKEKIKILEEKSVEHSRTSNHSGCEKEISVLKETISNLKKASNHDKCNSVIEKLKTALFEAETLVTELEGDVKRINEENSALQADKELHEKEIVSLSSALKEAESKGSHVECEERINTVKKALSVAKSINAHVQCEVRVAELEMEIRNMQSVTLADHSQCEDKINDLFFAVEKYADENNKLVESHQVEVMQYQQTIQRLESEVLKLTEAYNQAKNAREGTSKDVEYLESNLRLLKEENAKIKKKKVDDEKKVLSLEQQVISLTKELLEVKSQLRNSIRDKEKSTSLCAQLQEQVTLQDRKLALSQSSTPRKLFDDKENWETPSKVIRRSIAKYSNSNKNNDRCSLVMKAEEIHEALKDAEDICSRLRIPWVFHLEPEVTTHSWFDVNLRVWDQRTMSSVRWPREVFLGWLREMKEEIMSKTSGHKLFHSAPWLQRTRDPEPLPEHVRKGRPLRDEVESLQSQIVSLENLSEVKDKREALSAVTALGRAVTQLSSKLGLSSPLQPSQANVKL